MENVPLHWWSEDEYYLYGQLCAKMNIEPQKFIKEYFERKIIESDIYIG